MTALRGKRVVLTGATGGIGAALAWELYAAGAHLCAVARNPDSLKQLRDRLGPGLSCIQADITQEQILPAIRDGAQESMGGVDILINAAGVTRFSRFEDLQPTDISKIVATNLTAPMQLTSILLPSLLASRCPTVVNVGSALGWIAFPGQVPYSASKAGLRSFSEALRREFGSLGLRVIHISPRATRTPFNSNQAKAANDALRVHEDLPEWVARKIVSAIRSSRNNQVLGWPEKLIARVNQLLPGMVDGALKKKAALIRSHADTSGK